MTDRTVAALFSTRAEAERAKTDLERELQLAGSTAQLHASGADTDGDLVTSLRGLYVAEQDRHAFAEGIRRGGAMVSAQVEEGQVERALDVLDRDGALDLDQQEEEWRRNGWTGYSADSAVDRAPRTDPATFSSAGGETGTNRVSDRASATGLAGIPSAGEGARTGQVDEEVIPLVEEQIRVGKREVERGRVRVRTYVVETPVEQQVTLHNEHVAVERRAVDRAPTSSDPEPFRDLTIEVTETAEEAVVSKNVRVAEELVVRKEAEERVETVRDTVRHTEVEIDGNGAKARGAAAAAPTSKPNP